MRSEEGLTLETSALQIFHGGNSTFINSFDKTKFLCFTVPRTQIIVSFETRNLFFIWRHGGRAGVTKKINVSFVGGDVSQVVDEKR